jgi:hypothetical protein
MQVQKLLNPIVILLVIIFLFIGVQNDWFDGIFSSNETIIIIATPTPTP